MRLCLGGNRHAEQCGERERESTDTKREHNRRSSQTGHQQMTDCGCSAVHQGDLTYRTESIDCVMPLFLSANVAVTEILGWSLCTQHFDSSHPPDRSGVV